MKYTLIITRSVIHYLQTHTVNTQYLHI